jgi:nucleoid-associated protein YgaU
MAAAEAKVRTLETEISAARKETASATAARNAAELQRINAAAELATLRESGHAARGMEARIRELEVQRDAITAQQTAAKEDAARSAAAAAEGESKLAVALRTYSGLAKERDDFAARNTELEMKLAAATSAAETESKQLRAELARANELLAARTPPTRPAMAARESPVVAPTPAPSAPGPASDTESAPRTHTIVFGDTLSAISRRYYGTATRWPEILAANRDVLRDERMLVAGRTLRIP